MSRPGRIIRMARFTVSAAVCAICVPVGAGVLARGHVEFGLAVIGVAVFAGLDAEGQWDLRDRDAAIDALAKSVQQHQNAAVLAPYEHDHVHCTTQHVGEIARVLEPLREAAVGQRQANIRDGIDEEMADNMAATFYSASIHNVLAGECVV